MGEINPLKAFSTRALIDELARRTDVAKPRSRIVPCDECAHFKIWHGKSEIPADYNPCELRHDLCFRVPNGYEDTNWGYYRPSCKDRRRIDQII